MSKARAGQDSFIAGILDDDVDDAGPTTSGGVVLSNDRRGVSQAIFSQRNLRGGGGGSGAPALDDSIGGGEVVTSTNNYASLPITSTRRLPHDALLPTPSSTSGKGSHDNFYDVVGKVSPHDDDDDDGGGGRYGGSEDDEGGYGDDDGHIDENAAFNHTTSTSSAAVKAVKADKHIMQQAQPLFRYALIFINFSFVVASLLMIMAGVVARENSAVKLCTHCGELTTVALVFGIMLWLFALFGFNWIRQHNILLLLVYAVFLVILTLVLIVIIITGGAYDAEAIRTKDSGDSSFLSSWIQAVTSNNTGDIQRICALEVQLNCSGFWYGCCTPGLCFPNVTVNGTAVDPPSWYDDICPSCEKDPVARVCTDEVYSTVRKNLGGFLVIAAFSLMLVITGVMLAVLSRKVNLLLDAAAGNVLEVDGVERATFSSKEKTMST